MVAISVCLGLLICAAASASSSWLHTTRFPLKVQVPLSRLGALRSPVHSAGSVSQIHDVDSTLPLDNPHSLSISDCLTRLSSRDDTGLDGDEVQRRLARYGPNTLPFTPSASVLQLFREQFSDRLSQVLLVVTFISVLMAAADGGGYAFAEPVVILSILALNAAVGVWQSRSADNCLSSLLKMQPKTACVYRDREWAVIPGENVVPGDIIYLRVGDQVPADGRVIRLRTASFSTDESSLTGETVPAAKHTDIIPGEAAVELSEKANMVFGGTTVVQGGCVALVVGTGPQTEMGKISTDVISARQERGKTPLEESLDLFARKLTNVVGAICTLMWVANIPRFTAFGSWTMGAVHYAKSAVALGVAAVPEGLPAAITLCLSLGTKRMAQRNVIVRKLSSLETLGCTSVICTDKTGTLTTNQMTVKAIVTLSESENSGEFQTNERAVSGVSFNPEGKIERFSEENMDSELFRDFASVCSMCNDAEIRYDKSIGYVSIGEPTEAALKVLVEKMGGNGGLLAEGPMDSVRRCNDMWRSRYDPLATLEFSRERKSMSVLCRDTENQFNRLFTKGAPDLLLARCTHASLENGKKIPLNDRLRRELMDKISEMSGRPLRCLALAYKDGDTLESDLSTVSSALEAAVSPSLRDRAGYKDIESDMVFIGLCGIKDPARPDVAAAIQQCKNAGVRVMMITGDSKDTAVAIAREVGILSQDSDNSSAYTGKEFFALSPSAQLDIIREGNKVFCRAEPRDKQRLISLLESLGEVTAMTGDGVNDSPALVAADIGVAMGITGTEVAKGAADMVLSDDNFSSIVAAIEEGRGIYSNMQAFIGFLISSNLGEIATILVATLLGIPEPLTALHLLWVNLVTDGPPATALGFNPPPRSIMQRHPRRRNEPLLSAGVFLKYLISASYVGIATIGSYVWWFMDKGVTLRQLMNWQECGKWNNFAHSALAPMWPDTPCTIFTDLRYRAQSISLSVLVVIELLKALSAVSPESSLLSVPPWSNPWLILGVLIPAALHVGVMYIPFLSSLLNLHPLSVDEWKMVFKFALPILVIEELFKLFNRYKSSRTANKRDDQYMKF